MGLNERKEGNGSKVQRKAQIMFPVIESFYVLSFVKENPYETKALLRLQIESHYFEIQMKSKAPLLLHFSTSMTNHVWTTDCLLSPFFNGGIFFIQRGEGVNWKLIPMCLINGHWRMHSNLSAGILFHLKSHTDNYSPPFTGVNVCVALTQSSDSARVVTRRLQRDGE